MAPDRPDLSGADLLRRDTSCKLVMSTRRHGNENSFFFHNCSSFLWILVSHSGATSASSPEHERVFSSTGELVLRTGRGVTNCQTGTSKKKRTAGQTVVTNNPMPGRTDVMCQKNSSHGSLFLFWWTSSVLAIHSFPSHCGPDNKWFNCWAHDVIRATMKEKEPLWRAV